MELLFDLYCIHSPTGSEDKMRKFIVDYCKAKGLDPVVDNKGNIYVKQGESGTYPCIVAHMDEVHMIRPSDWMVVNLEQQILGMSINTSKLCGIGADDKNGIWVALKLLDKGIPMKAAFFVEEESGCRGSAEADLEFFKDCRFIVQCDRRNAHDFIANACGSVICSEEFIKDAELEKFGYKKALGSLTDAYELAMNDVGISCCNMSCGYYNPHQDNEYTIFEELKNCLSFVENIFEKCKKVYPFKVEHPTYTYPAKVYHLSQATWDSYFKDYKDSFVEDDSALELIDDKASGTEFHWTTDEGGYWI